jgi:hypothetical protein
MNAAFCRVVKLESVVEGRLSTKLFLGVTAQGLRWLESVYIPLKHPYTGAVIGVYFRGISEPNTGLPHLPDAAQSVQYPERPRRHRRVL